LIGRVQQNTQDDQLELTPEYNFVAEPGHPLYGAQVEILGIRDHGAYIRCVIADPEHPAFHYHIRQRWLSETPPPRSVAAEPPESPVVISLPALDKLVQRILSHQSLRRTSDHASERLEHQAPVATDTVVAEDAVEPPPFSCREEDSRRNVS